MYWLPYIITIWLLDIATDIKLKCIHAGHTQSPCSVVLPEQWRSPHQAAEKCCISSSAAPQPRSYNLQKFLQKNKTCVQMHRNKYTPIQQSVCIYLCASEHKSYCKRSWCALTLSHVENGPGGLQSFLTSNDLQAVQETHGVSSVLSCVQLRPFFIRHWSTAGKQ